MKSTIVMKPVSITCFSSVCFDGYLPKVNVIKTAQPIPKQTMCISTSIKNQLNNLIAISSMCILLMFCTTLTSEISGGAFFAESKPALFAGELD